MTLHWAVGASWALCLLSSLVTGAGGVNSRAWLDSGMRCLKEEQHILLLVRMVLEEWGWCWRDGGGVGVMGMLPQLLPTQEPGHSESKHPILCRIKQRPSCGP